MAFIQPTSETNSERNKWRKAIKMDMTPMVDLGFLLITFFIFTTSMAEPLGLKLYMPKDGDSSNIGEGNVASLLLGEGNIIFYYEGKWKDALASNSIKRTNYSVHSGIGDLIRTKQKKLGAGKDDLMLLIKPTKGSTYQNLVSALDEVLINDIKKYAIMEVSEEEENYFK